jgi:uncharacterized protein YkwD
MGFGPALARRIAKAVLALPVIAALTISVATLSAPAPRAEALDGEEAAVLDMINQHRAQNGLGPLSLDPRLNDVARWMANDLAANNYFSHTDSQGRDPFSRMDQLGYAVNTWRGENLVAGTQGAADAFYMWRTSEGHNANMLGANYTVIGIARAYDASSTFGWYWATEFGGPDMSAPPPPPAAEPQPAAPVVEAQPAPAPAAPVVTAPPPPAPTAVVTPAPTPVPNPPFWHAMQLPEIAWLAPSNPDSGGWVASVFEAVETLDRAFGNGLVASVD